MERQHTALGLQPGSTSLAVVDVNGHIYIYDYKIKKFTPWSLDVSFILLSRERVPLIYPHLKLPNSYLVCAVIDPVIGISFDPSEPSTMILWASSFIAAVKIGGSAVRTTTWKCFY